ncbi:hypothetical protein EDB86DRAFT_3152677 [Lactarius hatsudake]|nr:hypothetical protein EDB86DRAFT_3152677 [Lactarius hatsudake]
MSQYDHIRQIVITTPPNASKSILGYLRRHQLLYRFGYESVEHSCFGYRSVSSFAASISLNTFFVFSLPASQWQLQYLGQPGLRDVLQLLLVAPGPYAYCINECFSSLTRDINTHCEHPQRVSLGSSSPRLSLWISLLLRFDRINWNHAFLQDVLREAVLWPLLNFNRIWVIYISLFRFYTASNAPTISHSCFDVVRHGPGLSAVATVIMVLPTLAEFCSLVLTAGPTFYIAIVDSRMDGSKSSGSSLSVIEPYFFLSGASRDRAIAGILSRKLFGNSLCRNQAIFTLTIILPSVAYNGAS